MSASYQDHHRDSACGPFLIDANFEFRISNEELRITPANGGFSTSFFILHSKFEIQRYNKYFSRRALNAASSADQSTGVPLRIASIVTGSRTSRCIFSKSKSFG